MNHILRKHSATLKIIGIYALTGCLWIYLSDTALGWIVHDQRIMVKISIFKGSLYILLTSLLLYFLINRYNRKLVASEHELKAQVKSLQESEEKYHLLFEHAGDSISVIDMLGRILTANPLAYQMLGYTYDELIALPVTKIDKDPQLTPERIKVVIKNGHNTFDAEHIRKDGSTIWVSIDSRLITWNGQPAIMNICRDITERKQTEEALRESEDKHRSLIQTAMDGFWLVDTNGRLLEVNETYSRMSGYTVPELLTMSIHDIEVNLSADDIAAQMQKIIEHGEARFESRHRRKDGTVFHIETSVQYRHAEGGHVVAFLRDISERKLTEERLKATEYKYHSLFDSMTDGYASVDMKGNVIEFNKAYCKMIGFTTEEAHNLTYEQITPEQWHAAERKIIEDQVMVRGYSDIYEKEYRRKDGSIIPVELRTYLFRDSEGIPAGMWAIVRDISERKQAEKQLQEAREFLETAVAQSPSGILIADAPDVTIRMANPAAFNIRGGNRKTLTGIEVAKHSEKWQTFRSDGSPYPPEQLPLSRAVLLGEVVHNEEAIIRDEEGNDHWVSANAAPIRDAEGQVTAGIVIFHDITDRKQAEEDRLNMEKQLLHAQKLESLGILAGGIAHDFNNILTSIVGNADLALMRINKESPVIDNLHKIEQAAARAADLAKQMLAYSGKGKFIVESLDLNLLLEEMVHMLEVSISKKAVLRLNPTQYLPTVEADATQIRQIVMNLVINASEAIGDKSGVIAVTTGCMECDSNYLKNVWLDENLSEGLYVYLEIADSGCGMDKDTLAKIFDPFFTTKFTGRGLGMAAVLGIVRGHKGSIKVYSEPNKGTTFKILLPASQKATEIFYSESHNDDWRGQGKVLLVDDEENVRGIGAEMLKELGFSVITADDGRQAVEQFKKEPDIAFVILDLTMPHMDGEQCFRELRQIKSDVKVVMSSGFSGHEVAQKFMGKGIAGFIQKPYKFSVLKETIQKI